MCAVVTISIQADAGSAVYYTIDGTNPWPGLASNAANNFEGIETSALPWTGGVIQITGPCFFRARAFNVAAGFIGSKCSSIYFT